MSMPYCLSTLLTVAIIYIVISIALYYLQDYALFKPEKLPKDFQFNYENQDIEEYNMVTRDGATLNGVLFKAKGNPRGVVLYLKGNSKSIKGWGKFAVDFTRHNYNVFMVDYRGFGKSIGRRSQKAVKRDLQVVYNKLKELINEKYSLKLETPPTHATLYTLNLDEGIFLTDAKDISEMTKIIPNAVFPLSFITLL